MAKIEPYSTVTIHYQLLLEDGTEVESSHGEEPLTFIMGDGTLTDGMEQALKNRTVGDQIETLLSPEQGYGFPNEENVHSMPLSDFPPDLQPEPGQVIGFDGPDEDELVGTIIDINDDEVRVDFGHPLAGRNIIFKAEIIQVTNPD